jgi:hypothetical protein
MYNFVLFSVQLASETLQTSQNGLGDLMGRVGLFLLALLVFCALCGLAWRKIPALRNIVPSPQMVQEMEAEEAAKAAQNPPKPVRTINLAVLQEKTVKVEAEPVLEQPEPAEALTLENPATEQTPEAVTPEVSKNRLERTVSEDDLAYVGEGAALYSSLEAAIADGRPGSVVKAASDINGLGSTTPIVIVKREE